MITQYFRDKLAKLQIGYSNSFPIQQPLVPNPVFSDRELSQEPLKWLKYLLMDKVGLEPIDKIASQINRFRLPELETAISWVQSRFSSGQSQIMIVVKIVPWDSGAQLKNYRILSPSDIESTFDRLRKDLPRNAYELWCCESPIGDNGLNLGGRLNYPNPGRDQVLELVWFASPRFIESVSLPAFQYPYIRAIRSDSSLSFRIDVLHIPELYSIDINKKEWLDDFLWVAEELEVKRPSMEILANTVRSLGAKEVCFCFKMMQERLTVIDWDSELESTEAAVFSYRL